MRIYMPASVSALCNEDLNAGDVHDAPETVVITVVALDDVGWTERVCEHSLGMARGLIEPESDVVGYVAQQPLMLLVAPTVTTR